MQYASEIEQLLNLDGSGTHVHGAPAGLPTADEKHQQEHGHHPEPAHHAHETIVVEDHGASGSKLKSALAYAGIFAGAFIFFYVILNASALWAQISGFFVGSEDEVVLEEDLTGYYDWMEGYYFSVGDIELLQPNNDIDKDGLSNVDEYTVRTNPTLADSDGDGFSDGVEIINGYNPWGRGEMTRTQQKLVEGLNSVVINNRITYNVAENLQQRNGTVSGINTNNYNLATPGRLSIPRLNLQVPIIWSKDPADFDNDLTKGVIHYPGTALPGDQGTVYISGHSSDYFWKSHPYRQVFAKLNHLTPGDDIFVDVYGLDGKTYNYRYQVSATKVYTPEDQTQFIDNSTKKLNLSTCWPIGTQKDRMVVSAIQVDL